jgi:8-oxo-dGTP pyrophosphatase MutT (NUDIX family)
MAGQFVKMVSGIKYYQINNIRAGGLLPYKIQNNKLYILINEEYHNKKLVNNSLGGKVDLDDHNIEETIVREFTEETGYLLTDFKNDIYKKITKSNDRIKLDKAKYIGILYKISKKNKKIWNILPKLYSEIFKGKLVLSHQESIKLKWFDVFNDDMKSNSYLLNLLIWRIRKMKKFKKFNKYKKNFKNKNDGCLFLE